MTIAPFFPLIISRPNATSICKARMLPWGNNPTLRQRSPSSILIDELFRSCHSSLVLFPSSRLFNCVQTIATAIPITKFTIVQKCLAPRGSLARRRPLSKLRPRYCIHNPLSYAQPAIVTLFPPDYSRSGAAEEK